MPRKCNYVFPFYWWAIWHCQQYKTRECCHVYAEMGSLYIAFELQNTLYCCKQYKCTRSLCKVTDIGPSATKFGFSWETFTNVSNIKFYANLFIRSHIKTCEWTDTLEPIQTNIIDLVILNPSHLTKKIWISLGPVNFQWLKFKIWSIFSLNRTAQ